MKNFLLKSGFDHFILPNSDQFFCEYLPEHEKRVEFLTGFTGSNAVLVFGVERSIFFTDSRYILQAKEQILDDFEVIDMVLRPLFSWFEEFLQKGEKVAIDGSLFSVDFVLKFRKIVEEKGAELVILKESPVNKMWKNRPKKPKSRIFRHDLEYCGVDFKQKIADLVQNMSCEAMILADLASICWLLNIRASDVEFSPLLTGYAVVYLNGEVDVFVPGGFELDFEGLEGVNFVDLEEVLLRDGVKSVEIDGKQVNYSLYSSFDVEILMRDNPIMLKKAQKNDVEVENARLVHKIDGLALVKFFFWLENALKKGEKLDEIAVSDKLLAFREEDSRFLYPSFGSISGFAGNGAVVHYQANAATNKVFAGDSLYLIDSGGQYLQGTTDVTRTIAVGVPSNEMKTDFTLVLKGHIALARAKFDGKTPTKEFDLLARTPLLEAGKDYGHGTGHGVGSFLSVHEGPMSISKRDSKYGLLPGMILSNEPGFYKENEYGIRVENLVLVNEINGLYEFETLTLAPIDYNLINFEILTIAEKKWLANYHKKLFFTYKDDLEKPLFDYLEGYYEKYLKIVLDN